MLGSKLDIFKREWLDVVFAGRNKAYGAYTLRQGADAEAVTYIQLKSKTERYTGVAISRDIVGSSLNALLRAASQLLREAQDRRAA